MNLGLNRTKVTLKPCSKNYPKLFKIECTILQKALLQSIVDIQHVGSTAIPFVCSKPIIDICLGVEAQTYQNYLPIQNTLKQLGYTFRHDFFDRKFFAKGPANCRTHYLHLVIYKGPQWLKMLKFRDALNSNPHLAKQYNQLKLDLAAKYPNQRKLYTASKTKFIEQILKT